jgi:hypothetical protein
MTSNAKKIAMSLSKNVTNNSVETFAKNVEKCTKSV